MKRLLLSALVAGTFLAGGVAVAQNQPAPPPPPHGGHGLFGLMDTNKDRVITRAEVTAELEKRFAALDTNKDGVISAAEWKAARDRKWEERLNERFNAMDTDKNGQISREEMRAAFDRRVEGRMADRGRDGAGPGSDMHGGDRRGPGGWGHGRGFGRGFGHGPQGDVTKAQFMAGPLHLFDVLDSNHDGKISPAEREAAFALMHPMGPAMGPDRRDAPPPQVPDASRK
ncbi:MAG TPA: EF-hand domain-containing protein [Sphingobium sp.]|uniref:EF-hand domain-containing protein n=1 Tax=Sphingobium sp. TaxID=1912891 RepID=UPI002ED59FAA